MPSRTDQLHSYQFMVQRVIAALVMRETDPARSPFRRVAGATLAGVLFAVLGVGGALGYGLLFPGGSTKWRTEKAVIVEKETGALYVYREDDKQLHPVVNYASARLIAGSADAATVTVSHRSLDDVPRGAPLGIPGAPDALPSRKLLSRDPWTICSSRGADGTARSVLFVGGTGGEGGRALREDDKAQPILVVTPDKVQYVIFKHRRHRVSDPGLLPRLVWNTQTPYPVATAFINAIPAGVDMEPLASKIPNFGAAVTSPAGGKVGQAYAVRRPADDSLDYFVVTRQGALASLTRMQMELLLGSPQYQTAIGRTEPTNLDRGELGKFGQNLPKFIPDQGEGGLPDTPPNLDSVRSGGVCATVTGPKGASEIRVEVTVPTTSAGATGTRSADGTVLADRVVVRPGYGVLVSADTSPDAKSGTMNLVTDVPARYAVPGNEVLAMLGYGGVKVVRMPAELVSLIPAGRALDPQAARGTVPVT